MSNNLIQSTNEITFEELYKKYYPDLFLYVCYKLNHSKENSEDIASEAFTLLFERWDRFDPKSCPALISWLRKTARFLSYNCNRRAQHLPTVPLNDMMENENIDDPSIDCVYREDIRRIREGLSEEEFRLFEHIVIYNRSLKQIAPEMNVSTETLKVRWFRLKNKIRRIL